MRVSFWPESGIFEQNAAILINVLSNKALLQWWAMLQ